MAAVYPSPFNISTVKGIPGPVGPTGPAGPAGAGAQGSSFEIEVAIAVSAGYLSTAAIPLNARVRSVFIQIITPYSPGTTISVGVFGDIEKFLGVGQFTPGIVGTFTLGQATLVGSSLPVLVTIGGSPGSGSGLIIVTYVNPLT